MKPRILLLAALAALSFSVQGAEVEGVKFEDKAKLGNAELVLNGIGLRNRLFFKVYAIGLYLPGKKGTAAEVLAQQGAKRLHIVTLRDLTAEQFADALVAGIEKNHPEAEFTALKVRIEKFRSAILALKEAPKGTTVAIDWLPDSGTRLVVNGTPRGDAIPGEDFQRALLKIWLGEKPAQDDLKEALLGKSQ